MPSDKKYFNIRRFKNGVDMGVIDIPQDHLEMTLKNHPEWVNLGEVKTAFEAVTPPNLSPSTYACPICGNPFGSEKALQVHKTIHQPTQTTATQLNPPPKPKRNVKKPTNKRKRKAT